MIVIDEELAFEYIRKGENFDYILDGKNVLFWNFFGVNAKNIKWWQLFFLDNIEVKVASLNRKVYKLLAFFNLVKFKVQEIKFLEGLEFNKEKRIEDSKKILIFSQIALDKYYEQLKEKSGIEKYLIGEDLDYYKYKGKLDETFYFLQDVLSIDEEAKLLEEVDLIITNREGLIRYLPVLNYSNEKFLLVN